MRERPRKRAVGTATGADAFSAKNGDQQPANREKTAALSRKRSFVLPLKQTVHRCMIAQEKSMGRSGAPRAEGKMYSATRLRFPPLKRAEPPPEPPNEIRRFFQTAANSQNTKNRAIRPLFCPKAPPKYRPFRHKNTAPAFSTNLSAVVQKSFVIFSQYFVTYYCMRPKSIV